MKVGFCQFNVVKKEIDANLKKINRMLEDADVKLVVLPELCMTGYVFTSKDELIELSGEGQVNYIIEQLTSLCKRKDFYIVAGISEAEGDKLYNTAIVVGPSGLEGKYRKMHPSKFETIFEHGNSLDVFDIEGIKIGITICFDIWIPEATRLLVLKGAQIICCPSNFGGPWTKDIARTRAMENKVYSILCNRIGEEPMDGDVAHFRGESQIVDYMGDVLAEANNEECVCIVDIEPEEVVTKETIMSRGLFDELKNYGGMVKYNF